jgi:hypothetical protein
MKRREFIAGLGSAAAWPLATRAQQGALPVIGYHDASAPFREANTLEAFRKGLNETGFIEGQNVAIEYHSAVGQYDRLREIAAEMVRSRVASSSHRSASQRHSRSEPRPRQFRSWFRVKPTSSTGATKSSCSAA